MLHMALHSICYSSSYHVSLSRYASSCGNETPVGSVSMAMAGESLLAEVGEHGETQLLCTPLFAYSPCCFSESCRIFLQMACVELVDTVQL